MKKVFMALLISGFFLACEEEQQEPQVIGQTGTLSATMNSALWQGQDFNNAVWNGEVQGIVGSRLDIGCRGSNGVQMVLTVSDTNRTWGEHYVAPGLYESSNLGAVAYVQMNNGIEAHVTTYGTLGYVSVNITSCNPITQTASGTFSFEVYDNADSTLLYNCINGEFEDCQYAFRNFP